MSNRRNIYVLEDDEGIRELLKVILEEAGYEVKLFATVASFRTGVLEEQPDLVIMDIWLPDGDGRSACLEMRKNPGTAAIPILMMTAQYGVSKVAGASDLIAKPFDIADLVQRVEKLLPRRGHTTP